MTLLTEKPIPYPLCPCLANLTLSCPQTCLRSLVNKQATLDKVGHGYKQRLPYFVLLLISLWGSPPSPTLWEPALCLICLPGSGFLSATNCHRITGLSWVQVHEGILPKEGLPTSCFPFFQKISHFAQRKPACFPCLFNAMSRGLPLVGGSQQFMPSLRNLPSTIIIITRSCYSIKIRTWVLLMLRVFLIRIDSAWKQWQT